MEILKSVWDFFQNEVLGMGWLSRLISTILNACGLDTTSRVGGSIQFFIYHKNYATAWSVNFNYLVYSKLLPTRKNKKDTWQVSRNMGKHYRSLAWYSDTVLFLFLYSVVYWLYEFRITPWCNFLIPYFFTNG